MTQGRHIHRYVGRRRLAWGFGLVGTILVPALLYIVSSSPLENITMLSWNELGDFISGLFAPLAFIWFISALIYQSAELSQNTDALRLQSEEMRNSVEQASRQAEELKRSGEYQKQHVIITTIKDNLSDLSMIIVDILRIAGPGYFSKRAEFQHWEQFSNGDRDIFFRLLIESPKEQDESFYGQMERWSMEAPVLNELFDQYLNSYAYMIEEWKKFGVSSTRLQQIENGMPGIVFRVFKGVLERNEAA